MGINKFTDTLLSLAQRLECYDPARHGGEVMASQVMDAGHFLQNISLSLSPSPKGRGKKVSPPSGSECDEKVKLVKQ